MTDDRRASDRIEQCVPAWVGGESSNRAAKGRHVRVANLSITGVGFHDPVGHYRLGATHWLIVNGGPMRLSTRMKIVRCEPLRRGRLRRRRDVLLTRRHARLVARTRRRRHATAASARSRHPWAASPTNDWLLRTAKRPPA